MSKFDFIIFGASGFTGEYVANEISKHYPDNTFAIAGRSQSKLNTVQSKLSRPANSIIIADVKNQDSLIEMAKQGKVLINCVGPYRFFGLPVVKACIAAKSHYCDISGEPWFLESAEFKYNDDAKNAGVYCVGACGFDSIPSDMGIEFARKKFVEKFPNDSLNNVSVYINFEMDEKIGYVGHATTLECAVHGFSSQDELAALRRQIKDQHEIIKPIGPKVRGKKEFHVAPYDNNKMCCSFPGSDRSIIFRSQQRIARNNVTSNDSNVIQPFLYFTVQNSILTKIKMLLFGAFLLLLTKFAFGRRLIINNPSFFTNGMFNHDGPTDEQVAATRFNFEFFSQGIDKNNKLRTKVSGRDPGYAETSMMVSCAAATLLNESDKLPDQGGVMTTAYAFRKTSIYERLIKRGMKFEVLE